MERKIIFDLPPAYCYDESGFIRQVERDKFDYSLEYKDNQSTNEAMSFLRLGWLSSFFTYEQIKQMDMVDVGCGNGSFVKHCEGRFKSACGYDVVGESISEEELYGRLWDLIVLSDVLEHFDDINDLFKIQWRYCMVSFPETPEFETFDELKSWRHFKPNEHLYCLHYDGMKDWIKRCGDGVEVMGWNTFEDLIRTRWDEMKPNISTMLLRRRFLHGKYIRSDSLP